MSDIRDRKTRPLLHAILTGTISGITRTVATWIINHLGL
jgi:hypothetical protein